MGHDIILKKLDNAIDLLPALSFITGFQKAVDSSKELLVLDIDARNSGCQIL
jgi:hypothetical protein